MYVVQNLVPVGLYPVQGYQGDEALQLIGGKLTHFHYHDGVVLIPGEQTG